jgi:hypothetical protein
VQGIGIKGSSPKKEIIVKKNLSTSFGKNTMGLQLAKPCPQITKCQGAFVIGSYCLQLKALQL